MFSNGRVVYVKETKQMTHGPYELRARACRVKIIEIVKTRNKKELEKLLIEFIDKLDDLDTIFYYKKLNEKQK